MEENNSLCLKRCNCIGKCSYNIDDGKMCDCPTEVGDINSTTSDIGKTQSLTKSYELYAAEMIKNKIETVDEDESTIVERLEKRIKNYMNMYTSPELAQCADVAMYLLDKYKAKSNDKQLLIDVIRYVDKYL